jgi:hypothetical protein
MRCVHKTNVLVAMNEDGSLFELRMSGKEVSLQEEGRVPVHFLAYEATEKVKTLIVPFPYSMKAVDILREKVEGYGRRTLATKGTGVRSSACVHCGRPHEYIITEALEVELCFGCQTFFWVEP